MTAFQALDLPSRNPAPLDVMTIVTFGRDIPGKMQKRRADLIAALKGNGVPAADAKAAVTISSSKPHPVTPLFATETGPKVLEYTHVLSVSRQAVVRLERIGIPMRVELNRMQ